MDDIRQRFAETIETLESLVSEITTPGRLQVADDGDLLTDVRVMERLGRLGDAARCFTAAEVAYRSRKVLGAEGLAHRLGCATPAELLERIARILPTTARTRMRLGAQIRPETSMIGQLLPAPFDEVATVLSTGRLGVDSATAITTALARATEGMPPQQRHLVRQAEHELVCAAIGTSPLPGVDALPPVSPVETTIQAETWAALLNPDGSAPAEKAFAARSFLLHRPKDGLIPVSGLLTPEVAGQVQRVFDTLTNPRQSLKFLTDEERAAIDEEDGPKDPRSRAQRQHDAIATVFGVVGRSEELPTLGGASATMVVQVLARNEHVDDHGRSGWPYAAHSDAAHSGAAHSDAVHSRGAHSHAGAGYVDGLTLPLPPEAVAQLTCANGRQRVVLRPGGGIVSMGTTERTFNRHQRRAMIARDGGCIICGEAAWACEAHHVVPWERRHTTHVDNGVLLCWFHHRTIDTSGWRIRMVDGSPQIMSPPWLGPQVWRPARASAPRRIAALAERLRQ